MNMRIVSIGFDWRPDSPDISGGTTPRRPLIDEIFIRGFLLG
jgi:hypothetical protein